MLTHLVNHSTTTGIMNHDCIAVLADWQVSLKCSDITSCKQTDNG